MARVIAGLVVQVSGLSLTHWSYAGCCGGEDCLAWLGAVSVDTSTTAGAEKALPGPSPRQIVEAIQATGLPAANPCDNTRACASEEKPEDGCEGLVTTDQVSVYSWHSESQAARFTPLADCSSLDTPSIGGVRCRATLGCYTLLIGNDSDFPVPALGLLLATSRASVTPVRSARAPIPLA